MNSKTIALYLSLGLASSLLIGAGVNAEQLNDMPTMRKDNSATDNEWIVQDALDAETPEAEVSPLMTPSSLLDKLKVFHTQGHSFLKGEFPNVHTLEEEEGADDDCSEYEFDDDEFDDDDDDLEEESDDDDDDDDEFDDDDDLEEESDDDDDEDDDDEDDHCEEDEGKGAETKKKVLLVFQP